MDSFALRVVMEMLLCTGMVDLSPPTGPQVSGRQVPSPPGFMQGWQEPQPEGTEQVEKQRLWLMEADFVRSLPAQLDALRAQGAPERPRPGVQGECS